LRQLTRLLGLDPSRISHLMANLGERGLTSMHETKIEMNANQRISLAERLIRRGYDPRKVSRYLDWQEFEEFASNLLERNGFRTLRHLVFKARKGRREIDLLAWNDTFFLAIDCKHWMRGLSRSRLREVARDQIQRSVALAERQDILFNRCGGKIKPRSLRPVILVLSEPPERTVEGVPVVSISKLISFLYGISPVDTCFHAISVNGWAESLPEVSKARSRPKY